MARIKRIKTSIHLSVSNVSYLRRREDRAVARGARGASLSALIEQAVAAYASEVEDEKAAPAGDSVLVPYRIDPAVLARGHKASTHRGETLSAGVRRYLAAQQRADEGPGSRVA